MASLYSTKVTASGGRHGSIRSEDGPLDLKPGDRRLRRRYARGYSRADRYQQFLGVRDLGVEEGRIARVSYAIFGIPLSWVADHYSRRMVILFGALTFAAATALSAFASSFWTLLLGWIFVGIGESSLSPSALSLLADKFPRERLTTAISIFPMGPKLGHLAAFSLAGLAISYATTLLAGNPGMHIQLRAVGAARSGSSAACDPRLG